MLVLTRKPEEKIVIGDKDKIIITILKVQGGKVSIGIQADKKWQIVRKELLDEDELNEESSDDVEQSFGENKSKKTEKEPMELIGASVE